MHAKDQSPCIRWIGMFSFVFAYAEIEYKLSPTWDGYINDLIPGNNRMIWQKVEVFKIMYIFMINICLCLSHIFYDAYQRFLAEDKTKFLSGIAAQQLALDC